MSKQPPLLEEGHNITRQNDIKRDTTINLVGFYLHLGEWKCSGAHSGWKQSMTRQQASSCNDMFRQLCNSPTNFSNLFRQIIHSLDNTFYGIHDVEECETERLGESMFMAACPSSTDCRVGENIPPPPHLGVSQGRNAKTGMHNNDNTHTHTHIGRESNT